MKNYFISTEKSLLDTKKIWNLIKECFWSKNIPIEYVERFTLHSLCFGAYSIPTNELIGFGRVISDYTTYAYLCDVVIDQNYRRKGVGSLLISSIMNHPELAGLKTWSLRTTEEARKIYENHGFSISKELHTQLEINNLNIYSESFY